MKRILTLAIIISLSIAILKPMFVGADGGDNSAEIVQSNAISNNEIFKSVSSKAGILFETTTGTVIAEKSSNEKRPIGHLAKLMTVLLTQEQIKNGKLNLKDKVTASANANSQKAPQIWLNAGEKITVDELLKAITVGNANDACVALAEKIGGSETKFLSMMNDRAKLLRMKNTHFDDVCGNSEKTVSTAYDLALLSKELIKYSDLTSYFTTWICNIRNKATELVSINRHIRTYKGCLGLKSCASKIAGECLISVAKRGNMVLCSVLLDSQNDDSKFSDAKAVMDYGFTEYEIYEPEIDKEITEKIPVKNGEELNVDVKLKDLKPILIKRGISKQINCDFVKKESVQAPVAKGYKVGDVSFKIENKTIFKCDIVTKETVNKIGMAFAIKKILCNLLYI